MDKNNLLNKESFNINTKNNRFILKLFGEMNHEYINIEKDEILTISKTKIDTYEKKGQISKWQFNLDQIYSHDTTFEELYENEIENNDFLHDFNKESQYRTISFIGDRNDNLTEDPYKEFIFNCIKECLNEININKLNDGESTLIPIISFCEISKVYIIDYLKNITDINNYENKDKQNNNIINNPKLNYYEDDIIINDLNQVQISNENEFASLLNLSKKNVDFYRFNKWTAISKEESITQIITLKLLKSKTNECYSKINFILYKAYEILDDILSEENENILCNNNIDNISNINSRLKKSIVTNKNKNKKSKKQNNIYNLYTKDNYAFFQGVQNKINFRVSYILKYIKDTLSKGSNLFIVLLPCEYQYLLLIHDLLDNISMRKLIIENIILDEQQDNISSNGLGEYYKFENVSELNENNENMDKENLDDASSFQSFSKNNSINTNISSLFYNERKNKNFLCNSCMSNEYTQPKTKRVELNTERLRKINDKTNIINLFELFDKLSLNDYDFCEN